MKIDSDSIRTREVLDWKGLHLLNFSQSSCSQKVRILLSEKGLDYRSHEIDLKKLEHISPWYLGINPRGVVPVLIDNGDVHIESNDILEYIEERHRGPQSWMPADQEEKATASNLLELEDALHQQLRVITMGFMAPAKMMAKSEAELEAYRSNGPDDPYRCEQIDWWREFGRNGISEKDVKSAIAEFRDAFQRLDRLLARRNWLLADHPTVVDIAWFINIHRLKLAGYPIQQHANLSAYYNRILKRPAFKMEINKGPLALRIAGPAYRYMRRLRGTDLSAFCPTVEHSFQA